MDGHFGFLNVGFFTKAEVFPGSIGTFRYRFQRTGWTDKPDSTIQAWIYENVCFELAQQVETVTVPWTEEGVETLRQWLEERLAERGTEPYRIPYPPVKAAQADT